MFGRQLQLIARWDMSCCACGGQNGYQSFGESAYELKCKREIECEDKCRRGA